MSKYKKPVMLVMEEEGAKEIIYILDNITNEECSPITAEEFNTLCNFIEALKMKLDM